MTNAREQAAKAQGLHPTDFSCIGYLSRAEAPVSPKQIIAHLNLTSGSGTAVLDRLEAAGYTRRLPNPDDRRSLLIELNRDKAAEPLQRYREIDQSYRKVTREFTEQDLSAVARFLEAMGTFTKQLP
ncbi:MAG: MarR family transcriptional regulator [Devosia sp.]|nr:MarR family transcriptional regulator [Devosia sp.]